MILDADYFVHFVKLPEGFDGFVTPNDDGTYSVYIDPSKPEEVQRETYKHEVAHLTNDDFSIGTDPLSAELRLA